MNSLSSPGRAPKQPAAQRRTTILAGARQVFATSSFAQADTSELAAAAGVKPAALYRYFPTKRDLYLETLSDAGPRLLQLWRKAYASAADPPEAIRTIGMAYYDHAVSRSPTMRLWFQAVGEASDPEVRAVVVQTLGAAVGLIEDAIREGQRSMLFRDDIEARTLAWHFMGIGFSMDLIHVLGFEGDLSREKVSAWGDHFIDSIRRPVPAAATPGSMEAERD